MLYLKIYLVVVFLIGFISDDGGSFFGKCFMGIVSWFIYPYVLLKKLGDI